MPRQYRSEPFREYMHHVDSYLLAYSGEYESSDFSELDNTWFADMFCAGIAPKRCALSALEHVGLSLLAEESE